MIRCFQILENAGLSIHEGDSVYRLHPALRGCLAKMYPPPEDMKRWFVRLLAYAEIQSFDDESRWLGMLAYNEANCFYAKTLAEKLDMRVENLELIRGLAYYALHRSEIALAEERYRELAEKSHQYGDFDNENSAFVNLANLAADIANKRKWTQKAVGIWNCTEELSANVHITIGYNARLQGDFSATEASYKRALAVCEREGDSRVDYLYSLLGELAQQRGDIKTAIEWYQKSWRSAKTKGAFKLQAMASRGLGHLLAAQGNAKEALKRYQEALDIATALQDPDYIALTLNGIGNLLIGMGAYAEAKNALIKSVQIAERIGDIFLAAGDYNTIGVISQRQKDFISAKDWYKKALSMWESLHDEGNAAITRDNLDVVTAMIANSGSK